MIRLYTVSVGLMCILIVHKTSAITSPLTPYTNYQNSIELQPNVADLWWTVDEVQQNITFELHIKTTGWIALGISPAGGMNGADIGLGWIDKSGQLHFQDRFAYNKSQPVIDTTTKDWFGLKGREENGWTAIQSKRALDSCDTMDVPIKSGTNILIFAYGLEDPDMSQPNGIIYYHGNRRGSRMIPLRSYGNPSSEAKFAGLDYFDFQLKDYVVPSTDTTYHCKIYKAPSNFKQKRHAIAHKTIIDPSNRDLVHHMLFHECNPTVVFDDNNLPDGLCDEIYENITECASDVVTGWGVGGDDIVEFVDVAGYPVGGDFEIKYYMIQIHYDNPTKTSNRRDSSGIRFYLGNELRRYDLGCLTFGIVVPFWDAFVIPPRASEFRIDSYCPAFATKNISEKGITVVAAFPHTHLQGRSVWTKIIRNRTAVDYLFNAEAFDFNYQFVNRLPKRIQLYPGDEFATRCVYSTTNKNEITLSGERTKDEMCLHFFMYYPRMENLYFCLTKNSRESWLNMINSSDSTFDFEKFKTWLLGVNWTQELVTEWQKFHDNASREVQFGDSKNVGSAILTKLPEYKDLTPVECKRIIENSADDHQSMFFLTLFFCIMTYLL